MTASDQPLVSIITPVYNGEKYIQAAIESVLAQTWTNWDYVIVNNRSTDRTPEIADAYAEKDHRIRVVTNEEFVRVIPNHNIALDHAAPTAKYIKFVHADDLIYPECVEKMVRLAEDNPSVGVVGAYCLKSTKVVHNGLTFPSTCVSGRWLARISLLGKVHVFGNPTCTLLRADAVRTLKPLYNEANVHADIEACFRVLQDWDFGFVHQVLTYTREHETSVTTATKANNTQIAGNLAIFLTYGPRFLSPSEYHARFAEMKAHYFRFLARRAFAFPGKAFWRYHRDQLEKAGLRVTYMRLLPYLAAELVGALIRPSDTLAAIRLRRNDPASKPSRPPTTTSTSDENASAR